jgi:hypothetical protein
MNRNTFLVSIAVLVIIGALIAIYVNIRAEPVEQISSKWTDSGHADRASESFVHWDEDEPPVIPTNCAKCHSAYGFLDFVGEDGTAAGVVDNEARTGTVVNCNVCHNPSADAMTEVVFPSGETVTDVEASASCLQCHQGLQSTDSVRDAIAGLDDDVVNEELGFINVHYYVGAATKYGSEVRGGYQYEDRTYAGFYEHTTQLQMCTDCHDAHSLEITPDECSPCHLNVVDYGDIFDIRTNQTDYDGDGNMTEGVYDEITTLHDALYVALQEYTASVIGTPIVYSSQSFPYYGIDTDGDGELDEGEVSFGNRYATWTPRLVRTAYNYHYVQKDPGAFAHNPEYVVQILYDSLDDLSQAVSVDMSSYVRPTTGNMQ